MILMIAPKAILQPATELASIEDFGWYGSAYNFQCLWLKGHPREAISSVNQCYLICFDCS
jgi:hypothetical protein